MEARGEQIKECGSCSKILIPCLMENHSRKLIVVGTSKISVKLQPHSSIFIKIKSGDGVRAIFIGGEIRKTLLPGRPATILIKDGIKENKIK